MGTTNTAVSYVSYALLVLLSVHVAVAAALAWGAGAVNGYVLNRRWTFRARDDWRARSRYTAIMVAAALLNAGVVWLVVGETGIPRLAAYAVAVPPVTLAAFTAMRAFVFDRPLHGSESGRR